MADNIDWIQSQRGLCKVEHYLPGHENEQNWTTDSAKLFKQAAADPLKILTWLRKDLERCALGIQDVLNSTGKQNAEETAREPSLGGHSLQPGNAPSPGGFSVYDKQLCMDIRSNSGSPEFHLEMKNTLNKKEPKDTEGELASAEAQQDGDKLSLCVSRLSNLVISMAHKEINEKSDGADQCINKSLFATFGEPGHKSIGVGTEEGKNNPSENSDQMNVNLKETKYEDNSSSKKKTLFYKEVNQQSSNRNEFCHERGSLFNDQKQCHHKKRFGQDEFTNTLSKGILVYANNVVSDMMVTVMKTMKIQASDSSIACMVLKKVLLKHSKEVVSDLIDSCMKNLHNITGTLMTDSDFVSAVKRTLFNQGSHKAAEIVQAMLNHLHNTLIVQKPAGDKAQSQSLTYASVKSGLETADSKSQNLRFAATKTETVTKEKEKTCAETIGNHIIKQGLTLWHENKNKCNLCSKFQPPTSQARNKPHENIPFSSEIQDMPKISADSWAKDLIVTALLLIQYHLIQQENTGKALAEGSSPNKAGTTAFGFFSQQSQDKGGDKKFRLSSANDQDPSAQADESDSEKSDLQKQNPENGMSSAILTLIQKLINESGCKSEGQPGNSAMDEPNRDPGKNSEGHASSVHSETEQSCEDAISGLTKMITNQFDLRGKEGSSGQFIDSLVDTVTKLCLMIAKYSNPESALAEIGNGEDGMGGMDSRSPGAADAALGSGEDSASGRKVIVMNQNPPDNIHKKQLYSILQWVAASQTNVPVLYFLDEDDEFLNKIQQLSSIAMEKGYSVGEIIQAVLKYEKEKQLEEALGNITRMPVLDWLLSNL
ncbi:A-kinase anchor protein 3 [Alligator sinensis]|uniref:A-kinase anchor protein 3 n=1 Tax=Alligator sinensis TaxID=38654 RepID=A0A3Q0GZJ3_ALLSI|nr:A-kinase anchor protein 3 [Alligator sinensis]XP_025064898.1 A-kinase anchor protein 3 [Alligator sinensis]XP_025064899.1 A-kinase anchor protein 3 [Alligator sinensis]